MRDTLAGAFEQQRVRLVAVAHRMLGSRADAEDAVQEAWLRLARQDASSIDNLAGWLTTVVARVCLDVLRSRKTRPEVLYGDVLVTEADGPAPEDETLLAESVGLALLVVLDTLQPGERLAFVLHDMFAVPFDEIGPIVGRSADATKMLASRARRKVQATPRPTGHRQRQRAVVDAFLTAARGGDFDGLLRVLDPDVTLRSYTTQGLIVRVGAEDVAGRVQRGVRAGVTGRVVLVNGEPGIVAFSPRGKTLGVMACTVVDGRITEILSTNDPDRVTYRLAPPSSQVEAHHDEGDPPCRLD